MGDLKTLAVSPWCVGLFCGLDFSREVSTHFGQEKLVRLGSFSISSLLLIFFFKLKDQLIIAEELDLPVILTQVGSLRISLCLNMLRLLHMNKLFIISTSVLKR